MFHVSSMVKNIMIKYIIYVHIDLVHKVMHQKHILKNIYAQIHVFVPYVYAQIHMFITEPMRKNVPCEFYGQEYNDKIHNICTYRLST